MASITLRATNGTPPQPLTNAQIDANFTNLNNSKVETTGASPVFVAVSASTIDGKVVLATDSGGSINMGRIDGTASSPFIDFNTSATAVDYNVRIGAFGPSAGLGGGIFSIIAAETLMGGTARVQGNVKLESGNSRSTVYSINRSDTGSTNGMASIGLSGAGTNGFLGQITFSTGDSDVFTTALTERMRINSSGNLGIGTNAPATKVHALTPSATAVAFRAGNSASYAEFQVDASGNSQLIAPNGVQIFNTGGSERVRINASGNMGIGTNAPAYKLDIVGGAVGTTAGSQTINQRISNTSGNVVNLEISNTRQIAGTSWMGAGTRLQEKIDATSMAYIQFNGGSGTVNDGGISFGTGQTANATDINERLRIDGSGNILQSTSVNGQLSNTISNLNVGSGASASSTWTSNAGSLQIIRTSTAAGNVATAFNTGGAMFVGTSSAHSLALRTNNVDRLSIDSTGNATLSGDLTVSGGDLITTASFNFAAAATALSIGAATGTTTINNTTLAAKAINASSLNLTGNATVTGTITHGSAPMVAPTGTAPIYAARAWGRFNGIAGGTNYTGTYVQSNNAIPIAAGTTVIVTNLTTTHGLEVGDIFYSDITSGTGVDGWYTVSAVLNAFVFSYTAGTSLNTSGAITLPRRTLLNGGNIKSIVPYNGLGAVIGAGQYSVNFITDMPVSSYAVIGTAQASEIYANVATNTFVFSSFSHTPHGFIIITTDNDTNGSYQSANVSFTVFG